MLKTWNIWNISNQHTIYVKNDRIVPKFCHNVDKISFNYSTNLNICHEYKFRISFNSNAHHFLKNGGNYVLK